MLSFFRKYEKTFFLIVFLPAIIGMGVTSVIVTVLTQHEQGSPGKMFGEPIPLHDWQSVVGPYSKLMRGGDESNQENQFRFYAFTKAAERAGIRVSDAEVAESIISKTGMNIARLKASERIRAEGIDTQTTEGQQKFRMYFLEEISKSRENFTDEDYARFLQGYGITMQEYENHQRRVLMQEKLEQVISEAATVAPEDIWKEFRDKNQKREAEVVTLEGAAYVPSAGMVPTDDEIKKYYDAHKALYDEPRRVSLEYVAAPFEKTRAELTTPSDEQLRAWYDKHTADFTAYSGTVATVSSFENVKDKVLDRVQTQAAKERAQALCEKVAAKLDEQRKTGKVDMRAACDAVTASENTHALVQGTTPLLEADEFFTHPLLTGYSAQRWANAEPQSATRTSDPLGSEKAVSILRTAEVKEKLVPTFEQIKDQVQKDYISGGERELKKYYTENTWKYRTNDKWKFDLAYVLYDEWDGGKDKEKALAELAKLKSACDASYTEHQRADLGLNTGNISEKVHVETGIQMDAADLGKDPRFSNASSAIQIAKREEPSVPFERPDGKGKFFFVLREKIEQKVPDLADIKDTVAKDVLAGRGYERCKAAARKVLGELEGLTGDALASALKARGLTTQKTGFFVRTATALPGFAGEGSQIVQATFALEPELGFGRAIDDDLSKKVYLVRCAGRQDPADDTLTNMERLNLRHELVHRKQNEYVTRKMTEIELRAKGVSEEHVKWVRDRRDGPNGRVSSKVRQVYVPNDKATLDTWLEGEARKRIDEALAKLKADEKWERVCLEYSEDEATRARGGEMTVARGDLAEQYGFDFEAKLFELPADGQVSVPIKSKKGLHLIKIVRAGQPGAPNDAAHGSLRTTFRHILVKTDPKVRQLKPDVQERARAIARKKIEEAKARIEKGEPFVKVAAELGAEDDTRAKGETFTVPYLSTVMQKAFDSPIELTADALGKIEPFEVKVGNASEWHLALCARDPQDREPAFRAGAHAPRIVFECVAPSKETVLAARQELAQWTKDRPDHDPTSPEIVREWKRILRKHSTAVSAQKEGAFGLVAIDPALRGYDMAAVSVLSTLEPGTRSAIIETKDGFHYMECISVETKPADDEGRNAEVAEAILRGTEWADEKP